MHTILEGLEGVTGLIDDMLIHGKDEAEHDARLVKVMERLRAATVTLNSEKCAFRKPSVKFLGQLISKKGVFIAVFYLRSAYCNIFNNTSRRFGRNYICLPQVTDVRMIQKFCRNVVMYY